MSTSTRPLLAPSFKNLLFTTDFSPYSEVALPYLHAIAEQFGSMVHVVHVLAPEPTLEVPLDKFLELDTGFRDARKALTEMMAGHHFAPEVVEPIVAQGAFWPVVERCIQEKGIDLVVLGTRGRRGLKKLVLGSKAEEVFRLASCPVLTVSPESALGEAANAGFPAVLVTTDFSDGSSLILDYAVLLARAYKSRLVLLHVVESLEFFSDDPEAAALSSQYVSSAMDDARQRLEQMIPARTRQELNAEMIVEAGGAAEIILKTAASRNVGLIAMGARYSKASALVSHLPWRTASEVVCQARCPVLTVRI